MAVRLAFAGGDLFPPRLLDKAADVRDDPVALVSPLDDAVLHVDDQYTVSQ